MANNNRKITLLENTIPEPRKYSLIDRDEPNLYRGVFPYHSVPRIVFDYKEPPLSPAAEFLITDTTFRDGQQSRPPFTVPQIVHIFKLLSRLSGPGGIIRKSEFFLYSAKDRRAVLECQELGLEFPVITGWIRAASGDLQLIKEMGLKETGILTSLSDYHIYLKLGLTRAQAMEKYLALVKEALAQNIVPRCHFEDVTRADIYGFVVPFAQKLKELAVQAGSKIILRLCDTMGMGVTYPGAALPRSVPQLVRALIDEAGFDGADLEWHGHNDFHKGFINASTAWLYGLGAVNGTLLSFGERTGNTPIEALMVEYAALQGHNGGMDFKVITEMAHYFETEIGHRIPSNYPLVGRDFNVTSAGIHADGLLKNEEIYNIFDTTAILNRPPAISINDKSGMAGVAHWLNQRLELAGPAALDKKHPGIIRMYKAILREYEQGRISNMSGRELERMARHFLPHCFSSQFDHLKDRAKELVYDLMNRILENENIRSMDPGRLEKEMAWLIAEYPFIQFMYATDAQGVKITKNITQLYSRAKFVGVQDVGINLSDREWFIGPMDDGKIHITDFYTSRVTGALCITVSGPIRDSQDDITGILGFDIRFEELAKMEDDGLAEEDDDE